jgi:peroxiredoxin
MNHIISRITRCTTVVAMVVAFASCQQNKFHVTGNITDAQDSVLYFENMSLDGPVIIDSVKLSSDGSFDFSGDKPSAPEFYRLRIKSNIINVSIDSTETVEFKASYPTMAVKYEVNGSDNCTKIKELSLMQINLLNQAIALNKNNSLGMKEASDSIEKLVLAYKEKVKMNYIFKEPNKAYAYFALFQALGNRLIFNPHESVEDMRVFGAVATSWDTYYPEAERGKNLHNITIEGMKTQRILQAKQSVNIDPSKVTVADIIDIPLIDNHGNRRSLTELKGKVVLLDFHAFSAPNSTQRIMQLREIYNKYHAQGLEIYQVSVDPDEHFWKTQTAALPWINVHDPNNLQSEYLGRYNVQSIPTFFLISRANALHKRDAQIKDLDAEIKSLLAK